MDDLPFRCYPGGLSVSRSFGDISAKLPRFGGNAKVLIATPEIMSFEIDKSCDFLYMGCDGIFDKFKSQELVDQIWGWKGELEKSGNSRALIME